MAKIYPQATTLILMATCKDLQGHTNPTYYPQKNNDPTIDKIITSNILTFSKAEQYKSHVKYVLICMI